MFTNFYMFASFSNYKYSVIRYADVIVVTLDISPGCLERVIISVKAAVYIVVIGHLYLVLVFVI